MNEENLITYYNKFYEEKRLKTRHGKVEFITSMKYIHDCLDKFENPKICDIGAGMGAYSIPLYDEGYDITSVELVKHNLAEIKRKRKDINAIQGNAINLKKLKSNEYDVVLLFGPMYHLITKDEQIKALNEAKRIVKDDGIILVQYIMNEYGIITHGFKDRNILDEIRNNKVDESFHVKSNPDELYTMYRIEDINELNKVVGLDRIKIITPDGPSNYIREYLNKLSDEEFEVFIKYHLSTCERYDILGASAHTLDIIKKHN